MEFATNAFSLLPFIVLLLCIAVMPVANRLWWERNYAYVSLGLAFVVGVYYFFILNSPDRIVKSLEDYVSFIILLTALFVVSGGIHISVHAYATPRRNILLLSSGVILANLFGTTGASLLLIRPFLRSNKYRLSPFHIVLFIFIIGNAAGALTPIGDPPLFLGYIKGVPFFWTIQTLWVPWLAVNALLLLLFYIFDSRSFSRVEEHLRNKATEQTEKLKITGWRNLFYLAVIIGAVFIQHPHYLREGIMLAAAIASYFTTDGDIHVKNQFIFLPMQEVAVLFFGIFVTMAPALEWIETNAHALSLATPGHFYWTTGFVSTTLDNAPTYLSFLAAALGSFGLEINNPANVALLLQQHAEFVVAISLGAVLFGAFTYIGNAPNFMIKSISEHDGARLPHFGRYITHYALPILLPIFVLVWLAFI